MSGPRRRSSRRSSEAVSESLPEHHIASPEVENAPSPSINKTLTAASPAPSTKGSVRFSQESEADTIIFTQSSNTAGEVVDSFTQSSNTDGGVVDRLGDVLQDGAEQEGSNEPCGEELLAPLVERIPNSNHVVRELSGHFRVKQILANVNFFTDTSQRLRFSLNYFSHNPDDDENFWEKAWALMFYAIDDNMPLTPSQVKSCKDNYFRDATDIVTQHFGQYIPEVYIDDTDENKIRLRNVSLSIGYVFLDVFEMLTTPPGSRRIETIKKQLDSLLIEIEDRQPSDFFSKTVSKHLYYITGFLCRAGEKEKARRTDKNEVGVCIGAISRHFVSKQSDIEAVKSTLPEGLADLVDNRSVYGVLKYPDFQLYSLVARMEYCYSKLATPHNLTKYGGIVLQSICNEMARHEVLFGHFESLFRENEFEFDVVDTAFRYYIKVFSNLRLRDLCRKYNSQLDKTTTVGLRQSLATLKPTAGSVKKRSRKKLKSTTANDEHDSDEGIHNALVDIAESDVFDENDNITDS